MSKRDDDRRAYEERAAEIRRQAAQGKKIAQIMADQQAEKSRKLLEQALKQDEQDKK